MNAQTFFSAIIPSYNRKDFLKTAVSSVLAQTYPNFELIVLDDGSTDGTKEMISSFKDNRIIYLYQSNKGVAAARNSAFKIAKGEFLAFLDSDDRWASGKLERLLEYIKKYPDIKIFHTEEIWYRKGKLLAQKEKHKKPSGFVYKNALALCCIGISTAAVKRDVFADIGLFDETLPACEDYDFWLRATAKYEIKLIPENLTIKDGGRPDQLSRSVWGLDRFRIKALEKMLIIGTLTAEQHKWTLEELSKKCAIFAAGCEKRGKLEEASFYKNLSEKYI